MAGPKSTSSFYMTLPSNASLDLYPDNTLSSFTTKLDPPIDLQGSYEIGLSEIIYPRTWLNVGYREIFIILSITEKENKIHCQEIILPAGHYDCVKQIISIINDKVEKHFTGPHNLPPPAQHLRKNEFKTIFQYRLEIGKVVLTLYDNVQLEMSNAVADMLGFNKQLYTGGLLMYADHIADVHRNLRCLYVYINVAEDRIVGDTRAPLLRMVPLSGSRGEVIFQTYHDVHFVPIKFNSFDHITVNIRNGAGDLVAFQRGEVILTLQLRRRPFS